jgi:hypothetical protein
VRVFDEQERVGASPLFAQGFKLFLHPVSRAVLNSSGTANL